ncbi:unnamed protein product [Adineta steineri]|nr:unnamed protein product [Adineta steineri]
MKKCQGCLKSILKQNADQYELQCEHVEIFCINCQATYRRRDTHNAIVCLRNQMKNQNDLFELKLTSLENELKRQTELLINIDQQQKALIGHLDKQSRLAEGK